MGKWKTAIPLAERRCKNCGRVVADGVTFRQRNSISPNSYYPLCVGCERIETRDRLRRLRGKGEATTATAPRREYGLAAHFRRRAAVYLRYARLTHDPIYARRAIRAARDYETMALRVEAGKVDDEDEEVT